MKDNISYLALIKYSLFFESSSPRVFGWNIVV